MSSVIVSTATGRKKVYLTDPQIEKICVDNNMAFRSNGLQSPHYFIQCRETGFYIMTDNRDTAVGFAEGIKFLAMINRFKGETEGGRTE